MKLAIIHIFIVVLCFLSAVAYGQGVPLLERQVGPAPIEHRSLPACAEPCVQELMRNTSCTRTDFNCLCNHGLVGKGIDYCFETHCLPSVRDYLSAQNVTTTDCGVVDREQKPFLKITSISLGMVTFACIVLRLLERSDRRHVLRERFDDWLMMLNGVLLLAFTVICIELTQKGMGRDSYTLPFTTLELLMKLLMTHEVLYVVIIMLTKLSILFVYLRIFPLEVMPRLRILIPMTMGVVVAAGISQSVAMVFQCVPVHYLWDRLRDTRGGSCFNVTVWGWANGSTNVAVDAWLICMPLPELFKLRLHWQQKLRVFLMFIVGCLEVLVAIPRLVLMRDFLRSVKPTWQIAYIAFVSTLDVYIAVIFACLPRIYVLFEGLYRKYRVSSSDPNYPLPTYPMVSELPYIHPCHNADTESCPGNIQIRAEGEDDNLPIASAGEGADEVDESTIVFGEKSLPSSTQTETLSLSNGLRREEGLEDGEARLWRNSNTNSSASNTLVYPCTSKTPIHRAASI